MNTRIAVIIASTGRPVELARWPMHLARQTLAPSQFVLSMVRREDYAGDPEQDGAVTIIGSPGLCAQRNRGISLVDNKIDIIAFFDDDYVPSDHCLEGIARFFMEQPKAVGVTGKLLADGINGPGIAYQDAAALVRAYDAEHRSGPIALNPRFGLYGCNMAFRRSAITGLAFDENLPKYGWQEDVDFARQLALHGEIWGTDAFVGVHQGAKGGRSSGTQLGYSQIANPIYLVRKGTMSARFAQRHMIRNLLSNLARSIRPEPWVDRRGRLKGNMLALIDVVRGKDDPQRITKL